MEEPRKFPLKDGSLEDWLKEREECDFPNYKKDFGELSFPARYDRIKETLLPIHKSVEKGALFQSIKEREEFLKQQLANSSPDEISEQLKNYPISYLNCHGPGHVESVINKASEILREFNACKLNTYEGYLLLCAIQFHDVGNIFGRANHEKKIKQIMEEKCKTVLIDSKERNLIARIAMVHGGAIDGDRDTIQHLKDVTTTFNFPVREKLLAAILRLSDELADDIYRADKVALENGNLPEESIIYHKYSEALHSVILKQDPENKKHQVMLAFDFETKDAIDTFKKNGRDIYLLDEIYDRTLKMERERRYCMRFLRPYISIEQIRVTIIIQDEDDCFLKDEMSYTLEENGYPGEPSTIKRFSDKLRTGVEEMEYLSEWRNKDE